MYVCHRTLLCNIPPGWEARDTCATVAIWNYCKLIHFCGYQLLTQVHSHQKTISLCPICYPIYFASPCAHVYIHVHPIDSTYRFRPKTLMQQVIVRRYIIMHIHACIMTHIYQYYIMYMSMCPFLAHPLLAVFCPRHWNWTYQGMYLGL